MQRLVGPVVRDLKHNVGASWPTEAIINENDVKFRTSDNASRQAKLRKDNIASDLALFKVGKHESICDFPDERETEPNHTVLRRNIDMPICKKSEASIISSKQMRLLAGEALSKWTWSDTIALDPMMQAPKGDEQKPGHVEHRKSTNGSELPKLRGTNATLR